MTSLDNLYYTQKYRGGFAFHSNELEPRNNIKIVNKIIDDLYIQKGEEYLRSAPAAVFSGDRFF